MASKNEEIKLANNEKSSTSVTPPNSLQDMAPEIFISILKYLSPCGLSRLAQVCKKFNRYITTEPSSSTDLIWRQARELFLPWIELAAPEGMSERVYTRFMIEKGCQICRKGQPNDERAKYYFVFMIRVCDKCFQEFSASQDQLKERFGIPVFLIKCLPKAGYLKNAYWYPHAILLHLEYRNLKCSSEEKESWIEQQRLKAFQRIKDGHDREAYLRKKKIAETNLIAQRGLERRARISINLSNMLMETKPNGSPKWSADVIWHHCPSYLNPLKSTSIEEFTDLSWISLRRKIELEHEDYCEKAKNLSSSLSSFGFLF
ncbi:hypothetical protein G9A89_020139 [Geosiphon pyriformis]|nr:hypothetical protein G9A89_020139 [Geosiphon pyriformis]